MTGKLKRQRGGHEVTVKYKVNWPQNFVLSGQNKNRPSYDSLSIFQWVDGFRSIIQEESSMEVKKMSAYLSDIMKLLRTSP